MVGIVIYEKLKCCLFTCYTFRINIVRPTSLIICDFFNFKSYNHDDHKLCLYTINTNTKHLSFNQQHINKSERCDFDRFHLEHLPTTHNIQYTLFYMTADEWRLNRPMRADDVNNVTVQSIDRSSSSSP